MTLLPLLSLHPHIPFIYSGRSAWRLAKKSFTVTTYGNPTIYKVILGDEALVHQLNINEHFQS